MLFATFRLKFKGEVINKLALSDIQFCVGSVGQQSQLKFIYEQAPDKLCFSISCYKVL